MVSAFKTLLIVCPWFFFFEILKKLNEEKFVLGPIKPPKNLPKIGRGSNWTGEKIAKFLVVGPINTDFVGPINHPEL